MDRKLVDWCCQCEKPITNIEDLCLVRFEVVIKGRHFSQDFNKLHWDCLLKRKTVVPS